MDLRNRQSLSRSSDHPISEAAAVGARAQSKKFSSVQPKKDTCNNCRRKKTRCDKSYPCERCMHLCLKCRPQLKAQDDGEEIDPAQLVQHVMDRADYGQLAQTYIKVFKQVHGEGRLDRAKVITMMRIWRRTPSMLDITWGINEALGEILDVSPFELSDDDDRKEEEDQAHLDSVSQSFSSNTSSARVHQAEERLAQDQERLKQTCVAYQFENDGVAAVHLITMEEDRLCHATNDAYDTFHHNCLHLQQDQHRRHTIATLLLAAFVNHEERELFFRLLVEGFFAPACRSSTHFLKVFDKAAEIKLYMMQIRRVQEKETGHYGILLRFELPYSRYITDRPLSKTVITKFRPRAGRHNQLFVGDAGGGGADMEEGQGEKEEQEQEQEEKQEEKKRGGGERGEGEREGDGDEGKGRRDSTTTSNYFTLPSITCLPYPPLKKADMPRLHKFAATIDLFPTPLVPLTIKEPLLPDGEEDSEEDDQINDFTK